MDRREHWEAVYRDKADTELSWFQSRPETSLALIETIKPPPRSVVDVGGGQSTLAGELLDRAAETIAVLDISETALQRARRRLGDRADRIRWIAADALDPRALSSGDLGPFDLWHDRAVFHFLTDPTNRRRYVESAASAVREGGHAIVATFAPTGPDKCSGLPVHRCDADQIASEFAGPFELVRSTPETHTTPWGKAQDFTYALLRRVAD